MSDVDAPNHWPVPFAVGATAQAIDMIEALPLGIAVLDLDGVCYKTNDAFTETVGCDCIGGERILDLAVPADRQALRRAICEILQWRQPQIECRICLAVRPDETAIVTVIRAPTGWGFGVLLAVRDIREQVRLERQVAQATKMQAVGQLAGGIAHDFNNILTALLGLTDALLGRHAPGSDDFDDLDQIRRNAGRAADLVGQLLAFSRQQTLRPQVLEVGAVVEGVAPLLRRMVGPDVIVDIDTSRDGSVVLADGGQLERVFTNLAVNARDAMAGSGHLRIVATTIPAHDVAALGHKVMPAIDFVALTVADTGTGIPPEIVGKIFEPFFTTKPMGRGTGLGLSTVYGIVKQTGGFIFAAPRDGGGTCFTVYLPAVDRVATAGVVVPVAAPGLSGTVLLVEDERAVRLVVERALRRGGLDVVAVGDGATALAMLGERTVDVLVSDVVMPGIDGVELLGQVRALSPALPVVLMSGYAEPPQRRALDAAGAVFLAKPFAADELVAAVRAAIVAAPLTGSGAGVSVTAGTEPGRLAV